MNYFYSCLDNVGKAGECAQEYLSLYSKIVSRVHWKHYLAIKGVLLKLGDLITKVGNTNSYTTSADTFR